jgi:phage-related protein
MSGEVIKSFLVGLGFDVDESSLAKFNKSIISATIKVTALSTAIVGVASLVGKAVSGISSDFEDLGYQFRIISPAINKALVLRNEMLKAYAAAGINITQVVQNSVKLNMSLSKTKFILEAIYKSVGSRFFTLMTKQSDQFRSAIYKNLPKIQNGLEKFVKFIFKALEAVTELGTRVWSILGRVYDFFVMLDEKTNGWSTIILAVIAAWKLLNLEFLATPLGMIIAGLVAILALFDDFEVWKEGGKSLFDWSSFVPVINSVKVVLSSLWDVMKGLGETIGAVASALVSLFSGDFSGFFDAMIGAAKSLWSALKGVWDVLTGILGVSGQLGHWISGLANGNIGNAISNFVTNPLGRPAASPVGGNVQNSNSNVNVHQQTSINVSGAADANRTGAAVASQQSRVNRDLVDNMTGSTR